MARSRVGASRPSDARGRGEERQTYQGTQSGYGATRADSIGFNWKNPHAYSATQAAKAYNKAKYNAQTDFSD